MRISDWSSDVCSSDLSVGYEKMTGRFVIDYKITDDNLIYASYSRGYKSGGINPPLQPVFAVPESFKPEQVDAFEIGSKNSRSEERRVGKECVSKGRSRGYPEH